MPADHEERIAALERRLQESRTQAAEAMIRFNEREESQKAALRELEETLRGLANTRRDEQAERKMVEELAGQRRRIEELEARLSRAGDAGEDAVPRAGEAAAALADLARRLEAAENTANAAAISTEGSRRRAGEAAALSNFLARRFEAAETTANAAAASAEVARRRADEAAALSESLAARVRAAEGAAEAAGLTAENARRRADEALTGIEGRFEIERTRVAAEREEAALGARERDGTARKAESALRGEIEAIRRDAALRIEDFASRLGAASDEAATAQRAHRESIEAAIAEARAAGELARAGREAAGELRGRVEAISERVEQSLRAAGEKAALDRAAFEGRVAAAAASVARFETEIRGIILSRILRLEDESRESLPGQTSGPRP